MQLFTESSSVKQQNLAGGIEIYEVGPRRLYAKTRDRAFALFEDELTPEELMAIASDIAARRKIVAPDDERESVSAH